MLGAVCTFLPAVAAAGKGAMPERNVE